MKLVVELDDLAKVGKSAAIENAEMALARVQKLIASSPTLADVIGAAAAGQSAGHENELPLRERVLEFLLERFETWHPTSVVREACGLVNAAALLKELNGLRDEGRLERRSGRGRGYEWKAG